MSELTRFFADRQNDIDIFFTHLDSLSIDTNTNSIELHKIFKSQCILMLYNFIEGTVNQGIQLVFDKVTNSNVSHDNVTKEIKIIWYKHNVPKLNINLDIDNLEHPLEVIKFIEDKYIKQLSFNFPQFKKKNGSYFSAGSLDSEKIREEILKKRFGIVISDEEECLKRIKILRNNLAHGEVSFLECCHDITFGILKEWKNKTINYMQKYVDSINDYADNKKFLNSIQN